MTSLKHVYRSFVLKISKYQFAMFQIFKSKSDSSIVKYLLPKFQNQYIIEICLSLFPNWRTVKTFEIMRFIISYFLRNMIREKFSPFSSVRHIRLWSLLKIIFPSSIILILMKNFYKMILVDPEFYLFIKVILNNCPHKFTV